MSEKIIIWRRNNGLELYDAIRNLQDGDILKVKEFEIPSPITYCRGIIIDMVKDESLIARDYEHTINTEQCFYMIRRVK